MIDLKKYLETVKEKLNNFSLNKKSTEDIVIKCVLGEEIFQKSKDTVEKYRKNIKFTEKDGVLTVETQNSLLKSNLFIKKDKISTSLKEETKGKITEVKII